MNAPTTTPPRPHVTNPASSTTAHACFFCRQMGQPVWPVVVTLTATDTTPAFMPDEVEIETWACIDSKRCLAMSLPAPRGAADLVQ